MALHLFSPKLLAEDLANGGIGPREQAAYLTVSFLMWTLAYYFFLIPRAAAADAAPFAWMWWIEFFFVVWFTIAGIAFCLSKCRVDPAANFLIDFSCLYTPVALRIVVFVWGAFHLVTTLPLALFAGRNDPPALMLLLPWLTSEPAYDLLRLVAYLGMNFFIYLGIGEQMESLSAMRSVNKKLDRPMPEAGAAAVERPGESR
jgi:hypothetical protein